MEVQAWGADVYCGDQHRFQSFSCELQILQVIHQVKRKLCYRKDDRAMRTI